MILIGTDRQGQASASDSGRIAGSLLMVGTLEMTFMGCISQEWIRERMRRFHSNPRLSFLDSSEMTTEIRSMEQPALGTGGRDAIVSRFPKGGYRGLSGVFPTDPIAGARLTDLVERAEKLTISMRIDTVLIERFPVER